MKYKVGDNVTLSKDYDCSDGTKITSGTTGEVKLINVTMQTYTIKFATYNKNVIVTEDYLL